MSSLTTWVFFLLFWAGLANQNISGWRVLPEIYVYAFIETLVTAWISNKVYARLCVKFNYFKGLKYFT